MRVSAAKASLVIMAAATMAAAAASLGQQRSPGTITLRAQVITIDEHGIVATGSPQLTSEQGTMSATQFTVALGPAGRAETATAEGGVRFRLAIPVSSGKGSYTAETGSCTRAVLYPTDRRAQLLGHLVGQMEGPGLPPITLLGNNADVYARTPTRRGRITLTGGENVVTAHA